MQKTEPLFTKTGAEISASRFARLADDWLLNGDSGPVPLDSEGVLTSDPFVPRSNTLTLYTQSESASVAPMVLILTPTADTINPDPSDNLFHANVVNNKPGTGSSASFGLQKIDISSEFAAKKPIHFQFRQATTAAGAGYFTLFAFLRGES